jgi:hypothetical protein
MKLLKRAAALAVLVSTLWAPMSRAAVTWYVNQYTGTDYCAPNDTANCGRSAAHAFKTIAAVNSRMNAGDLCYVYPGAYHDKPNPKNAAWDGDLTHGYTFVGLGPAGESTGNGPSLDLCCDDLSYTLTKDFLNLRNFRFTAGFMLADSCDHDSLTTIQSSGEFRINGADHIIIDGLSFTSSYMFYIAAGSGWTSTGVEVHNSVLSGNTRIGSRSATSGVPMGKADSLLFHNVDNPYSGSSTGFGSFEMYGVSNASFNYCNWQAAKSGYKKIIVQDSCTNIQFNADTLKDISIFFAKGYNYGTTDSITVDSCFIRSYHGGSPLNFQTGMKRLSLTYSTVVAASDDVVLWANRWYGRNLIDHNTFWSTSGWETFPLYGENLDSTFTDTTLVTNNIVYNAYKSPQPCHWNCVEPNCLYPPGSCISMAQDADSSFWAGDTSIRHVWVNGNLYVNWNAVSLSDTLSNGPGGFTAGMYEIDCLGRFDQIAVGDSGTTNWNSVWCPGCDDSSHIGSPAFADSTLETFDGHLMPGSVAIANALDGSDVGAVAYGGYPIWWWDRNAIAFFRYGDSEQVGYIQFCNLVDSIYTEATLSLSLEVPAHFQHGDPYLVVGRTSCTSGSPPVLGNVTYNAYRYDIPDVGSLTFGLVGTDIGPENCAESTSCPKVQARLRAIFVPVENPTGELDETIQLVVTSNDPRRPSRAFTILIY